MPPPFKPMMQQSLSESQTLNLSGHVISLNLRIELIGDANQRVEPVGLTGVRGADVVKNSPAAENNKAPLLLPNHGLEAGEAESIAELKKQLQHAESSCSRLEELYQTYRLRWLEECYRAGILEKYAPSGISTCSPRQIEWNAPSPIQTNGDDEVED
ncbi:hypothetical protein C8R48DRAFT_771094 [Suillus tomentosus]|nr:hypothetical protein C8R48DRAFT_771094 [Suillus tomentosus]